MGSQQLPVAGLTGFAMHSFFLILAAVPALNALCAIQGCDKWYNTVKNNASVTGACAVMFDENCCKSSKTFHIVKKGEDGKKEEKKSANFGNIRDNKDRYDRNKLVFTAVGAPNFVEEIDDDFDDMNEDIESYRCKC